MNEITVKASTNLANLSSSNMSLFSLIGDADIVVKLVMLLMLIASIYSWSIIIDKSLKFNRLNNQSEKFEKLFWSGQMLEQLYERLKGRTAHPLANIFIAAMHEWGRHDIRTNKNLDPFKIENIKERIAKAMELVKNREIEKIETHIDFLAIIGSNATFVGLFGTVWGIMHSFQSIAASKNTSLAVVAPGIAEALLATAIGLIAAIPAAIFYNILQNKINLFYNKLDDFSTELGALLAIELEEGRR